jgi:hypothetical protein
MSYVDRESWEFVASGIVWFHSPTPLLKLIWVSVSTVLTCNELFRFMQNGLHMNSFVWKDSWKSQVQIWFHQVRESALESANLYEIYETFLQECDHQYRDHDDPKIHKLQQWWEDTLRHYPT